MTDLPNCLLVVTAEVDAAVETKEFAAMRGWAHFAPHVRSQTRVVVPVG